MSLPSAYEVALLLVLNVDRYSQERGRGIARARVARKTLSEISGRTTFRGAFIDALTEELDAIGWTLIGIPDGYAILEHQSLSGWTKISSSRIAPEINGLRQGKISSDRIEHLLSERLQATDDDGE
jgi:hypothetical protein